MAALFKNGIIADNVGDSLSDYDAFISAKKELMLAIDAKMKKKEIAEYDESLSRIESMFENR